MKLRPFILLLIASLILGVCFAGGRSLNTEENFSSDPNGKVPAEMLNIPGATPIGNDECFACHPLKKPSEKFITMFYWQTDVHAKVTGSAECESCHGPGSKHQEANSRDFIVNPKNLNKWKAQAVCTACHMTHEAVDLHGSTGVACLDCHVLHTTDNPKYLVKLPEPNTCYMCHPSTRLEFDLPSHHPVNEGAMKCTACHLAHFANGRNNLVEAREVETCGSCHASQRGPFVYSHITFEGCKQCHLPHGGSQQFMLTNAQPSLCVDCHLQSTDQHPFNYSSCTLCHIAIHGSNKQRLLQR